MVQVDRNTRELTRTLQGGYKVGYKAHPKSQFHEAHD
jgi:hypothetical protein